MISLLVTIMLFGILSIIFFYNTSNQKLFNKKKLDLACYSALQNYISENEQLNFTQISYTQEDSIKINIASIPKGIFNELTVTASDRLNNFSKVKYLLASKVQEEFENGLIISKENLRASVVGDTKIVGDMLLTTDRIKLGRISGKNSASRNYHKGVKKTSTNIHQKYFNQELIQNLFSKVDDTKIDSKHIDGDFFLNEITLSEISNAAYVIIGGDLTISGYLSLNNDMILNIETMGKVVVESNTSSNIELIVTTDSSIVIGSDTYLENLIFSAQKNILIKGDSKFKNVQFFSKKGIEVFDSYFSYPTIIALYSDLDLEANLENSIKINSSIINGSVLLVNSTTGLPNNKNIIEIDESSTIQGLIYSENYASISGNIYGIIYTYSFWYYKEPTEYINWLVDVKLDRDKLDEDFLLPIGFSDIMEYKILKETWLN